MGIFDTFSKRQKKRDKQAQSEVYQYTDLPKAFRVQVVHIWKGTFGPYYENDVLGYKAFARFAPRWDAIHDTLARERGVFTLAPHEDNSARCIGFLLDADAAGALDIIDLSFGVIARTDPHDYYQRGSSDDPVAELNARFREHAIGYEFVNGELMRVDSHFIHGEVVKPAISLLHEEHFRGASDEFLKAHEHYRHERHKEAIAESLKAFESTMKTICDLRQWPYGAMATAKPLIDLLVEKGLIPSELIAHFGALRSTLESGLPTIRNRQGGHGQGKDVVTVPGYVAAYALHLAASNIVFLVEAHKAMK